jgi:hypothetical protein
MRGVLAVGLPLRAPRLLRLSRAFVPTCTPQIGQGRSNLREWSMRGFSDAPRRSSMLTGLPKVSPSPLSLAPLLPVLLP